MPCWNRSKHLLEYSLKKFKTVDCPRWWWYLISFCSLISVWLKFAMLTTYQKPNGILLWFWNMLYNYNCLIHVVKIASFINLIYRNLPAMLKTKKKRTQYSSRFLELKEFPLIYNCFIMIPYYVCWQNHFFCIMI